MTRFDLRITFLLNFNSKTCIQNFNFLISIARASGHVDRFTDVMVRDVKTGDCYRADHLLEGQI